jgi:hypothetical protein
MNGSRKTREVEPNQGQVSEVSRSPEDATAGYPPSASGTADEGTAGPHAAAPGTTLRSRPTRRPARGG